METNNSGVIIADTSGLVSLFSIDDRNHTQAVNAAKRLQHEQRDILIPAPF
jgi:predicted nucleic acid-binding protein